MTTEFNKDTTWYWLGMKFQYYYFDNNPRLSIPTQCILQAGPESIFEAVNSHQDKVVRKAISELAFPQDMEMGSCLWQLYNSQDAQILMTKIRSILHQEFQTESQKNPDYIKTFFYLSDKSEPAIHWQEQELIWQQAKTKPVFIDQDLQGQILQHAT